MADYFKKIIFKLLKPQILIFIGRDFTIFANSISRVFGASMVKFFSFENIPFIFNKNKVLVSNFSEKEKADFILKNSSSFILIINEAEGESLKKAKELALKIPFSGFVIFNADKISLNGVKNKISAKIISYAQTVKDADFKATDINKTEGSVNLKINYKGDSVPFWVNPVRSNIAKGKIQPLLETSNGVKSDLKEGIIESVLAVAAVGISKNLNLVEISQLLKE